MNGVDASTEPELYRLLNPDDGWKPIRVFFIPPDRAERHEVPGTHGKSPEQITDWLARSDEHGYRGVYVRDYSTPAPQQPVQLRWASMDIDYHADPIILEDGGVSPKANHSVADLAAQVCDILSRRDAIVRYSRSGEGLHVLLLVDPDRWGEMPYERAKDLAHQMKEGPKQWLADAGIHTCHTGTNSISLWSAGGKNKTIKIIR